MTSVLGESYLKQDLYRPKWNPMHKNNIMGEELAGASSTSYSTGSPPGDNGGARGDDGSACGDDGSARGDDGSARGDDGNARGDDGSARGDNCSTLVQTISHLLCEITELEKEHPEFRQKFTDIKAEINELRGQVQDLHQKIQKLQKKVDKYKKAGAMLYIAQTAFVFQQAICWDVLPEVFSNDYTATIKKLSNYLFRRVLLPRKVRHIVDLDRAKERWEEICKTLQWPTDVMNDLPDDLSAILYLMDLRRDFAHPRPISSLKAKEKLAILESEGMIADLQLEPLRSFIESFESKLVNCGLEHKHLIPCEQAMH